MSEPVSILAIDPGPVESAWVVWDGAAVRDYGLEPNPELLARLSRMWADDYPGARAIHLAIEWFESFGKPVGKETFEAVYWVGRFVERWGESHTRLTRRAARKAVCHDANAKDPWIRQALLDRIGPPGTKRQPGPTYGLRADMWQALAVAVAWWDGRNNEPGDGPEKG